jgi:DNA-binding transcriptional LysR family regulator
MTLDWDKLKTFHAAAEAGSLTRASDALHLSQSAVSRQISALEAELGVKLFHRHARGLLTTEPGRLLFEATRDIAAKVAFAEAQVQDSRDEPTGLLRVTAPTALGALWLAPRISTAPACRIPSRRWSATTWSPTGRAISRPSRT